MRRQRKKLQLNTESLGRYDKTFALLTLILLVLGTLAIADASSPQALATFNDSYFFAKQQIKWIFAGTIFLLIGASINYKYWKKIAPFMFIAVVSFLILVLIPGFSQKVLGARRWLSLGPISFQPSELAKLTLAIYMAYMIDRKTDLLKILGSIGFIAALIMLQPDLGTNIVVVSIAIGQLFVAGVSLTYMAGIITSGAAAALILILTSEYRRHRLLTFLESSTDPLGKSYHMRQILLALGSGGIFGAGIGQSRQKHLFLPETASDSVFAVIAEEVGFVGSVFLIALLTFFVMRIFKIAKNAPDEFSKVLASGIGIWIGGQMFLNIASMIALTPLTGIPLPFFSYGGSSLVMILFAVGILLNISKNS